MSATAVLPPKRAARRRQLVDNLRDPIVVVEDALQMQQWGEGAYRQFRPVNAWQDWLTQQIGLTTFRINRIQRVERRLRDLESLRAIDCWEVDRRVEVEELAAKRFAKEPEHTVCRLLCSPAGCDWLIARWEALAQLDPATWTLEQKSLAFHLNRSRLADWSPALIADRVAGLRDHKDRLAEQDALARTLAESDLSEELSPALRRVRRQEKELLTRLKWFIRQVQANPMDRWLDSRYRPDYISVKAEPCATATAVEEADAAASDVAASPPAWDDEPTPDPACEDWTEPELEPEWAVTPEPAEPEPAEPAAARENDETKPRGPAPMTPAELVEHRKRRIDPARELARLRRSRRRTA